MEIHSDSEITQLSRRGEHYRVPGASDALSARLIEAHGYECVYIGSYATAASRFGIPDTGLLSLESASRAGAQHRATRCAFR